MNDKPLIFIIILNWNKNDQTLDCIRSVERSSYRNYKIVVIDNAPIEKLEKRLAAEFPEVVYLHNQKNLGFTGGNNQGIEYALSEGADYILLFNNDAEMSENCLASLVAEAESDTKIGLLSPVIYNPNKPNKPFFGSYSDVKKGVIFNAYDLDIYLEWEKNEPEKIVLWGTALLIKREVVEKIGLLDNDFFAYYEDNDFSRRVSSAGYFSKTCLKEMVIHHADNSAVNEKKSYRFFLMSRNLYLFWRKSGISKGESIFRTLYLYLPQVSALYREGKQTILKPMIAGLWQGIVLNRFGAPPEKLDPPCLVYVGSMVFSRPLFCLLPKMRWVIVTGQRVFQKLAKILRGR